MNIFVFPFAYIFLLIGTLIYLLSKSFRKFIDYYFLSFSQKNPKMIAFTFACIIFLFGLFEITSGHNWGDDHAQYIAQAKAIVTGKLGFWLEQSSYTYLNSTDSSFGTIVYPWGEPLLLAPLYKLFGLNYVAFKVESVLFLSMAMYVLYFVFLELTTKKKAFILTLFCAINTGYIAYANIIYADYPCLFFVFSAILFILKYLKERTNSYGFLIGVFIFCAVCCRTLALSALAALGCMDLLFAFHVIRNHDYKDGKDFIKITLSAFVPYFVFLVLYLLLKFVLPAGDGYGSLFTMDPKAILWLITRNGVVLTEFFCNFNNLYETSEIGLLIFVGVFLVICFIGMWKQRKRDTYLVFYSIITALVLFVFNGIVGHRYLLPFFPFLLYFAYTQVGKYNLTKGLLLSIGALMILYNCYHIYLVRTHKILLDESTSPESMEMYSFVKETVKGNESVYFMRPRVLNLYTDVHALTGNANTLDEITNRVNYMVLYKEHLEYQDFHSYCLSHNYPLIFESEWFEIYVVGK